MVDWTGLETGEELLGSQPASLYLSHRLCKMETWLVWVEERRWVPHGVTAFVLDGYLEARLLNVAGAVRLLKLGSLVSGAVKDGDTVGIMCAERGRSACPTDVSQEDGIDGSFEELGESFRKLPGGLSPSRAVTLFSKASEADLNSLLLLGATLKRETRSTCAAASGIALYDLTDAGAWVLSGRFWFVTSWTASLPSKVIHNSNWGASRCEASESDYGGKLLLQHAITPRRRASKAHQLDFLSQ
ncbi:hypothetical protein MNV49_007996 [Pseudohyphozyma bogoriensis]|nr:hypothetical protein MNV49_007996 [Pseudohyphozyma bogoriensis]